MIQRRSIVTAVILTFVTCGIYSIIWYYNMVNEYCRVNHLPEQGGTVILLTIVTCGIYGIYWAYKMGELVEPVSGQNDGMLYVILDLFALSLVNYCIWQDHLNRYADRTFY